VVFHTDITKQIGGGILFQINTADKNEPD